MEFQENRSPEPTPTAKKRNTLLWLFVGCSGIMAISGAIVLGFTWWGYHKAKSYAEKILETDSSNMKNVAELWSDVPRMDGMTPSQQIDMPAGLKIVARKIMDGMMRGLNNGKDPGHWDWTAFMINGKTSADVQSFYVSTRMTDYGWKPEGGCMSINFNLSGDQATFCAFQKQQADKSTGLLIISTNDKEHQAVSIFFIRQEDNTTAQPSPTPSS